MLPYVKSVLEKKTNVTCELISETSSYINWNCLKSRVFRLGIDFRLMFGNILKYNRHIGNDVWIYLHFVILHRRRIGGGRADCM